MRGRGLWRRILWVGIVEGGKQGAWGRILNQPPSFKEPQLNPEQTQTNVENLSGEDYVGRVVQTARSCVIESIFISIFPQPQRPENVFAHVADRNFEARSVSNRTRASTCNSRAWIAHRNAALRVHSNVHTIMVGWTRVDRK